MSKEKANWEVTLKNILYYINNEKEQQKVLDILSKYEAKVQDGKIKNLFQKYIFKTKKDYYEKVDYLIEDILDGKWDSNTKKFFPICFRN